MSTSSAVPSASASTRRTRSSTPCSLPQEEEEPTRPAQVGDTVELKRMGTRAQVLQVNKDGSLQLQAGILKISAKQTEVRVVDAPKHNAQKQMRRMVRPGAEPDARLRRPAGAGHPGHDRRRRGGHGGSLLG